VPEAGFSGITTAARQPDGTGRFFCNNNRQILYLPS